MDRENFIPKIAVLFTFLILLVRPEEVFNTTPPPLRTNFSCYGRPPGFFADVDANCRIYHTCDDFGNKFTYRCPEETAFRQNALICDHAHLVDCKATIYAHLRDNDSAKKDDKTANPFHYDSIDAANNRRSFTRTFQVIQRPNKSIANKAQTGFVFSASVFLRDLDESGTKNPDNEGIKSTLIKPTVHTNMCKVERKINLGNEVPSTSPPVPPRFESNRNSFGNRFPSNPTQKSPFANQSQESTSRRTQGRVSTQERQLNDGVKEKTTRTSPFNSTDRKGGRQEFNNTNNNRNITTTTRAYQTTNKPRDTLKVSFGSHRDFPYLETLRSIQANANTFWTSATTGSTSKNVPTTEIPVHALTLSLKPLVPNELEYDPYYPKFPTSTEAYYTPRDNEKEKVSFRSSTQAPWSSVHFKLPEVLPDLNSLEDLVDRRKLFYIPRIKSD